MCRLLGASPDLRGHGRSSIHVALGVDLRHVGLAVAEDDPGGFDAELLADARGVGVADLRTPTLRQAGLVGVPTMGPSPGGELFPLLLGEALPPLRDGLVLPLAQGFWRREGAVAGTGDGAAAGVGLVPLPTTTTRHHVASAMGLCVGK
jgi:hypothetical protein